MKTTATKGKTYFSDRDKVVRAICDYTGDSIAKVLAWYKKTYPVKD